MPVLKRRTPLVILILAMLTGGGYAVYWTLIANRIETAVDAWAERQRAEGYVASWAELNIGGFPFSWRVHLLLPRHGRAAAEGDLLWQGEALVATVRPWDMRHIHVRLPGEHRIERQRTGLPPLTGIVRAEDANLRLTLDNSGGIKRADLLLGTVALKGPEIPAGVSVERVAVTGEVFQGKRVDHRSPTADLSIDIDGITVGRSEAGPRLILGPSVGTVEFAGTLMGALPAGPMPDALAVWRDNGGTIEVRGLRLLYGPLDFAAEGTVALDGDLQPLAAFAARIQGFFETIDRLAAEKVLPEKDAQTLRTILGLLARPPRAGAPPTLTVPVTVQDRRLFIGPARLATVPAIDWSAVPNPPL